VGGIQQFINSLPSEGFFNLANHEYTWSFLIGFGLYNFFYLSGQWGFVQRYTSVSTPNDARKVGWLFGLIYVVSPVIWMLPPMVYRALNPELSGLQDEGAYLLMCKEVLPAGLLGLMLISLVFATTSSVQGVLNISAGVITNDLYKVRFPKTSEKKLMVIAKLASIFFGLVAITIAMLVPIMGGAKEVVLSLAALTGCPMYMPLIWSLFSKKQTGKIVLATTIISLLITLSFKFLLPAFIGFNLSRADEMILGVVVPAVLILFSEIILRTGKSDRPVYKTYQKTVDKKIEPENLAEAAEESGVENKQGLRMIAIGILVTGFIIGVLGLMSENGRITVIGMAAILLMIGGRIYFKTMASKN
jgi:Na+/proline symporter